MPVSACVPGPAAPRRSTVMVIANTTTLASADCNPSPIATIGAPSGSPPIAADTRASSAGGIAT